jgi:hypothetical protein
LMLNGIFPSLDSEQPNVRHRIDVNSTTVNRNNLFFI